MKRYLVSGGSRGQAEWNTPIDTIYGFDNVRSFFHQPRWRGGYVCIHDVLGAPEKYLHGVNFWWVSLNYSDRDVADKMRAAFDYARAQGTIVLGEPNGGYHANLFLTAPALIDLWRGCTCMGSTTTNPDMIRAYEQVYQLPAFGSPPPVDEAQHRREIIIANTVRGQLPPRVEESFVFGTLPTAGSLTTLQAAELFGIPLIVTGNPPFGADVDCWKSVVIQDKGGFEHVQWLPHLNHYHWLWLIANSRGVMHLNHHPSTGRYTMYAALLGKISLSNKTAWQEILFPEAVMPMDATGLGNWRDYARRAEDALPLIPGRLAEYSPERCQERFEAFLASLEDRRAAA
jgi:hypothetical protein